MTPVIIIIRLYRYNIIDDILYNSQILTALKVFNISLKEKFLMNFTGNLFSFKIKTTIVFVTIVPLILLIGLK